MSMEFQTKLDTIDDAVVLVNKLEHYNCVADAWIGEQVMDARVLMGLVGICMGKPVRIVVHTELGESEKSDLNSLMKV